MNNAKEDREPGAAGSDNAQPAAGNLQQNDEGIRKTEPLAGKPKKRKLDTPQPTLIQVAFPQTASIVFFSALVVGFGLVFLPTAFPEHFALNGIQANLLICIGAALFLAPFGGQATVRIGGFILAGIAAIAIGLFTYLQDESRSIYLTGTIRSFDKDRFTDLAMSNHNRILGAVVPGRQPKSSTFDFAIFKNDITESQIEISLVEKAEPGREFIARVNVADIEWAFGGHQRLEWELRETDGKFRIFDSTKRTFIDDDPVSLASSDRATSWSDYIVGRAWAEDLLQPADVPPLLDQLTSGDVTLRRGARDQLALAQIDAIPLIMERFREGYDNYQVRLGVVVALTEMLRRDRSLSAGAAAKLTNDDRALLARAAQDQDDTIRLYANEFLSSLGNR